MPFWTDSLSRFYCYIYKLCTIKCSSASHYHLNKEIDKWNDQTKNHQVLQYQSNRTVFGSLLILCQSFCFTNKVLPKVKQCILKFIPMSIKIKTLKIFHCGNDTITHLQLQSPQYWHWQTWKCRHRWTSVLESRRWRTPAAESLLAADPALDRAGADRQTDSLVSVP